MRKIPTVFRRDPDNLKHVLPEINPGCEWVLAGEGVATRKYDGTCVLVRAGAMFARREVKPGKQPPAGFEMVDHDEVTGKSVGWVPVDRSPEYARHWEPWDERIERCGIPPLDGTYELCGPKVNGNPEGYTGHALIPHGHCYVSGFELSYDGLQAWLLDDDDEFPMEGIVWHHPDGRMAKLKRRDFA